MWPNFCMAFGQIRSAYIAHLEQAALCGRLDNVMKTEHNNSGGTFGLIVGGVVALAAAIFIFTGGDLGGKKSIDGDQDLPPVAASDN